MSESLKKFWDLREVALKSGKQEDWNAASAAQVAAEKEQQAGVPPLTESPATAYYPKVVKEEKPMPKKNLQETGTTIPSETVTRTRASGKELIEKRAAKVVADMATLGESKFGEISEEQAEEMNEALGKAWEALSAKIAAGGKEPERATFKFTR